MRWPRSVPASPGCVLLLINAGHVFQTRELRSYLTHLPDSRQGYCGHCDGDVT